MAYEKKVEIRLILLVLCSSPLQVIVDHDYLGPLCLQFTGLPSVADVKNEIMERHGLPIKDQRVYCDDKMVLVIVLERNVIDHFNILKFILGSEAWGSRTKEMYYSLLSLKMFSFVLLPPSLAAKYEF